MDESDIDRLLDQLNQLKSDVVTKLNQLYGEILDLKKDIARCTEVTAKYYGGLIDPRLDP